MFTYPYLAQKDGCGRVWTAGGSLTDLLIILLRPPTLENIIINQCASLPPRNATPCGGEQDRVLQSDSSQLPSYVDVFSPLFMSIESSQQYSVAHYLAAQT